MILKIAITGAGIGGLSAASMLARDGHDVTIFERFETPQPVGSGLVIQPAGLDVLEELGLGDAITQLAAPITRMIGHDARAGRLALDVDYPKNAPGYAFHRASLFHLLWDLTNKSGVQVITSACVISAPEDGNRRNILLQDGREFGPFDLVVDAGGAGSSLSPLRARPLGYGALWANVPWPDGIDLPTNQLRQRYYGSQRMAGVLPIGRLPDSPTQMAAIFWSIHRDQISEWRTSPLRAWRDEVLTLWPEIAPFIENITRHEQMTAATYTHGTLKRPYADALVHIGDAAHRASPQLGQGANMALLDAHALAVSLRMFALSDALPAYAAMRRWHLRFYQAMSAFLTPMYQSRLPVLSHLRDHLLAPSSRLPGVRHGLTRLVSGRFVPPLAGWATPRGK